MSTSPTDVVDPVAAANDAAGGLLQPIVADLLGLGMYAKNAHWNAHGPGFRSIHLGLDELVGVAQAAADVLGERMTTLGLVVDGTPVTVARHVEATWRDTREPDEDMSAVVHWIVDAVGAVAARIRGAITTTAPLDGPTADLLSGIVVDIEKQGWLLRSEL